MTGERRTVLFVDDDPNILEGLKTRLHRQRRKWDMRFAGSGKEALELLEKEAVDVIVSDMRMPEMDGATLLTRVRELRPRVIRIVLSGQAEMDTALRAIAVAHQFLNKPCEPGMIENVIERACKLQALISEEVLMKTVGRIDRLPSLPKTYSRLVSALANENVRVDDIAQILKQDMAICAKTLQMVNSAFFRLPRTISRLEEAVSYLGFSTIKQVVLSVEVFQGFKPAGNPRFSLEAMQTHSLGVGSLAATLFDEPKKKEDAFVAGLLHDIGKLILATELPDYVDRAVLEMDRLGCPMHSAEESTWGVTHAEVGACLLGLWGLPYPMVEAVANHHAPRRVESTGFDLLASTHAADALIHEAEAAREAQARGRPLEKRDQWLDLAWLTELGVAQKVEGWREAARRLVAGETGRGARIP
jgi:putative nucleotidyltransferase with HDIG domain